MSDSHRSRSARQCLKPKFRANLFLALFSTIQYAISNPAFYSNALTCTAIFLPLSSLWASASLDGRFQASKEQQFGKGGIPGCLSSSTVHRDGRTINHPLSSANTEKSGASGSHSPYKMGEGQALRDLEAQGMVENGKGGSQ